VTERIVEFHPSASEETVAAYSWYQERSPAAAQAFLAELDIAIEKVAVSPLARPKYVAGTRRCLFRRFPFSLIYRLSDDLIEIVAVAHARRRPGYWTERLQNQ